MLNMPSIGYYSNFNLNETKLESINKLYCELEKGIAREIEKNLNNDEYQEKIKAQLDNRPIAHLLPDLYESNSIYAQDFLSFQVKDKDQIKNIIRMYSHEYDEERLKMILEIYLNDLTEESTYLNMNTLATTVNVLREFYADMLASINKVKLRKGKKSLGIKNKYFSNYESNCTYNMEYDYIANFKSRNL